MSSRLDYCAECWKLLPTTLGLGRQVVVIKHLRPSQEGGGACPGSNQRPKDAA